MTPNAPWRPRYTRRRFLTWCSITASLGIPIACRAGTPAASPSPSAAPPPPTPTTAVRATARQASVAVPSVTTVPTPLPAARHPTATIAPATPETRTATSAAKLNYLHTDGPKILDASGHEVTLTGLNWFGMETDTLAPHGLWVRSYESMLDQIVHEGYNCLRLPFSNSLFDPKRRPNGIDFSKNPSLEGLNGLQIMDTVVVAAGKRGLKIILDQHRPDTSAQSALWYTDKLSQAEWIAQWQALAARYQGNDAVIGADLHNEPSGPCTWGSGDPKTDWAIAAEACGNAILSVNPNWLILVEGIEKMVDSSGNPIDWTWQGGELMNARTRPIHLSVPHRLVYSPHDYGPSVYGQRWFTDPTFPDNMPGFWDKHWGYLAQEGTAPILVGEFGGRSVGSDREGEWQRALVKYLKDNRLHYTYWCLNPNSGDTGGLLKDDWRSVDLAKEELLKTYQGRLLENQAPGVVDVAAVPPTSS